MIPGKKQVSSKNSYLLYFYGSTGKQKTQCPLEGLAY